MIKVYNVHYRVMEYANEKLANFIDFYYDLLFDCGEDEELLFIFFPDLTVLERKEKCFQTIRDLYYWSRDKHIHELTPLHEYAIYHILLAHEDLHSDSEENIYDMKDIDEIPFRDSEEMSDGELIEMDLMYADTFDFYYENLFQDHDFKYIDLLLNRYILGDTKVFENYGIDIKLYEDLIPIDISRKYSHLFDEINGEKIEVADETFVSSSDLSIFLKSLIGHVNHALVNENLNLLLWNDDKTPKNEKSVQSLFYNTIAPFCIRKRVNVSREVNNGRGPIDFKFVYNHDYKVLMEIKLLSNTNIYKGLEAQLLQYMIQEDIKRAIYLVVVFYDNDFKKIDKLKSIAEQLNHDYDIKTDVQILDARKTALSASKISREEISMFKNIEE
ncbi:hypothetical protein ACFO0S_14220 [Chryseomicrobium palamuruense]|uniref:PD-(D/E)XK nuclease superfamily protein n=1 Tax=Chryseomicrobium palamuruense TaxID=682973 RepID=A0ABV8UY20_9BACL